MDIRPIVFWMLAASLAPRVGAQEPASPLRRDSLLQALVAEALERNPRIRERLAALEAAAQRIRPAGALPDPVLTTGVMDVVLPRFEFNRSDFTEVDVELMQEFPWPGTLGARTAVARAAEVQAAAQVGTLGREVTAAVATAYYRLRYLRTALETLARQRRLLDAAVGLTTTRYAAGTAPQSDAFQARLARDRLDAEEAALRGEVGAATAALRALLDREAADTIRLAPLDLAELRAHVAPLPPVDSLAAAALRAHPRIAAQRAALDRAAQTIRVERLAGRPDISLALRYGYRSSADGVSLPDFFSAFVGFRLPIWAGRKQHRLADAARADSGAAAAALRQEELRLTEEVAQVAAHAAADQRRLELLIDGVVPFARGTVESVLNSYRVGRAEFLSLLAAEDALYRAELEAAAVAAGHQIHLVMLDVLTAKELAP